MEGVLWGPFLVSFSMRCDILRVYFDGIRCRFCVCEMLRRMEKESSPRNEGNEWLKRLQKYERH